MKKLFFSLVSLLIAGTLSLFCKTQLQAQTLEKGNSLLRFDIGLTGYSYGSSTTQVGASYFVKLPPIHVRVEHMLSNKFSLGGSVGIMKSEYEFIDYRTGIYNESFKTQINYLFVGGLANYHFINKEKFNLYGGGQIGYTKVSVNDNNTNSFINESTSFYGIHVGARYAVTPKLYLNAEIGTAISLLTIGASIKM